LQPRGATPQAGETMPKTIQQSVRFDAPPERVFALYADTRLHAEATGAPARLVAQAGGEFMAHGGHILGRLLVVERPRLIVQTWRALNWKAAEADSILILTFAREGRGTRLRMVHANVPDAHADSIRGGWRSHYWSPWRRYLRRSG
jgi:activator of HSP90 ATPase